MAVTMATLKDQVLVYKGSWNPGTVADAGQATTAVTISGVKLSRLMPAMAVFGQATNGTVLNAQVTDTDTVYVRLENMTGGNLVLTTDTLAVYVFRVSGQ